MTPRLRKFALTTHISVSVGWIGAVAAYLVLVVGAMANPDDQGLGAAWMAMELVGRYAIVPLALASLITGLVMSLATPWGLFRHYWVLISFALTCLATVVLLQHMPTVIAFARLAADASAADIAGLRAGLRGELFHAGVGLLVLLVVEALNVHKPQGLTAFGQRRLTEGDSPIRVARTPEVAPRRERVARTPVWVWVVGGHAFGLAVLFVIFHITSGGLRHH